MRPQIGKQKILAAAMSLFESNGYFATTIDQIASEAGVSKGLTYNYFDTKEALLVGIIEQATNKMASVALTFDAHDSLDQSIAVFISHYLTFLKSERRYLKFQLTLGLMPELQDIVRQPQQKRANFLLSMVTNLFKQFNVRKAKEKARLFIAMMDGIALHYLAVYENYPLSSMQPALIQAAQDLCRPSQPKRR